MTNEQFNALVAKLEDQARKNPTGYRVKVFLLAMLGNFYVGAIVLLLLGLLAGLIAFSVMLKVVAFKMIAAVALFLGMVFKAMWVRMEPPKGITIEPGEAPELFGMVEDLRRQLGRIRFHHVLITDDFNAGVVQKPRLGVWGWCRNYLLIGLPLMKALTAEQLKAVLAHEFGHLSKGQSRLSNWIYRQRLRWSNLLIALDEKRSKGSFLFKPFLSWFAPYFNAYSFPMARLNEYEADGASVRMTSPRIAAQALTNVNVTAGYLAERFWQQIHKRADEEPHPCFSPYDHMGHNMATELDTTSVEKWLNQALARPTDATDTHPALGDRLAAIREMPYLNLPALGQASDKLLGPALNSITAILDQDWKEAVLPSWEERYREVQEDRRRFAELNRKFESGEDLGLQEAYDRAKLTETIAGKPDEALDQFQVLHERAPEDTAICLALGARLLDQDQAEACALIQKAMQRDEGAILPGCEMLRDYHWRHGRQEEARAWHQRFVERSALQEAAAAERRQVFIRDKFDAHGLSGEDLAELRTQLEAIPGLNKAYFVKKRVQYLAHFPFYILGFSTKAFFRDRRKQIAREVLRRIRESVTFPGDTMIISIQGPNYRFGRKFRWMRGARIV